MNGRRITSEHARTFSNIKPGDYWHDEKRDDWFVACPASSTPNHLILIQARLTGHKVTEHENGTITVAPSILVLDEERRVLYHGFLSRGRWSAA